MLHNPNKVGYNQISRRSVLQILGVSMGALAVGGCTSKLFERDLSSSNKLEPLAASTSSLFWRTSQARKNLDEEYLRKRGEQLKEMAKLAKKSGSKGSRSQAISQKGKRNCF